MPPGTGSSLETTTREGFTSDIDPQVDSPFHELKWDRFDENPIITGRPETHEQAGFGGIVDARRCFEDPVDDWYFYWAGHDKGGIWLSTATSVCGPWTVHGRVFDVTDLGGTSGHVSSPYPVYVPSHEAVFLYYHRAHYADDGETWIQDTHYATVSNDRGATVRAHHGEALPARANGSWDGEERSYLKVCRTESGLFGVYQGCDHDCRTPKIGFANSEDGVDWRVRDSPLFDNSDIYTTNRTDFVGTPHLTTVDGSRRVLLQWIPTADDEPAGIYSLDLAKRDADAVSPELVLSAEQEWTEGQSLHVVDITVHEGTVYLFYSDSARDDEQHIGIVTSSADGNRNS